MIKPFVRKYTRMIEDIYIDFINHTLLRDGIALQCEDIETSIQLLRQTKKSIIRWGDGESFIVLKEDIYFQDYSNNLREKLIKILTEYNDESRFYLSLPCHFLEFTTNDLKSKKDYGYDFYQIHKGTRYIFRKYCNDTSTYLNHFLYRKATKDQFYSLLEYFTNFKSLVVVGSQEENIRQFFKKFLNQNTLHFVKIPSTNAFADYDSILSRTIDHICSEKTANDDVLTMVAAGPSAKVLVYDLSKAGFIAHDVGKFFSNWLQDISK